MPEIVVPAAIAAAASAADPELAPLLLAIAHEESGFDPAAIGAVGEQGLTQIRPEFFQPLADRLFGAGASLVDPAVNLGTAAAIIRDRLAANGGDLYDAIQPWSTRPAAWALYQSMGAAAPVGPAVDPGAGGAVGGAALVVVAALAILILVR